MMGLLTLRSEQDDNWDILMRMYLRRHWGLHQCNEEVPEELVDTRRELLRQAWGKLHAALQHDFGDRLADRNTCDFLQTRLLEVADEVAYEQLNQLASATVRPCDSCRFSRDIEEDPARLDTSEEVVAARCKKRPALKVVGTTCGRFTYRALTCGDAFEPHVFAFTRNEVIEDNKDHLSTVTALFEEWRSSLNFSEALLD